MLKKKCNKCLVNKEPSAFYANKRMKDGLNTFCIECHKIDNVLRKAKNRSVPEFVLEERARAKQYRQSKRAAYNELTKIWRSKNVESIKIYAKKYREQNKDKLNAFCRNRKISLLNRIPNWLTADDFWMIEEAYQLAALRTKHFGFTWHVDHIIPLRGKLVSGFHLPTNLQVIPWIENQRKTNKFEVLNA